MAEATRRLVFISIAIPFWAIAATAEIGATLARWIVATISAPWCKARHGHAIEWHTVTVWYDGERCQVAWCPICEIDRGVRSIKGPRPEASHVCKTATDGPGTIKLPVK